MIAGRHPELVSAVVVEDVGPERPQTISNRRATRMSQEENGWGSVDELFAKVKSDSPRTADPISRAFAEHGSRRRPDGRIVWKRDPAILKGFVATELWETIRKIRAPIVYILGGASDIVPRETQEALERALPQARIVTIPGLGHYPSDEKPADFIAIVEEFFAQHAKPS
jgi:esterase